MVLNDGVEINFPAQMDIFKGFLRQFVQDEKSSLPSDFDRGYIDSFLRAQAKGRASGDYFTDEQLIISVQDFFTGGSGITHLLIPL